MKDEYLNNLIKQFSDATGISNFDINDKKLMSDFRSWLIKTSIILNEFAYFLKVQGINLDSRDIAEVGKGKCDSICLSYSSRLITPYISISDTDDIDKVIDGKMYVDLFLPAMKRFNVISYLPSSIKTYFTYNPYDFCEVRNWDKMNSKGAVNIILGMFGSISDKDRDKKMDLLLQLKKCLDGHVKYSYTEYSDRYLGVVANANNSINDFDYYSQVNLKKYNTCAHIDELIKEVQNTKQKTNFLNKRY